VPTPAPSASVSIECTGAVIVGNETLPSSIRWTMRCQ
jgi:hypothetical protein